MARLIGALFTALAAATPLAAKDVSPSRQAVLEARARMLHEARESGYWIVAPGEHLRLIARQFHPHDRHAEGRLSKRLFELNPHAFVHGEADRLIPGARLEIPPEERAHGAIPAPGPKQAAAPAKPAPPSTAAAPPATTVPAPEFASGAPVKRPAPAAPAPYVDQLIEGAAPESEAAIPAEEAALAPGQRYLSAEYRAEEREPPGGGHTLEQGVAVSMRRETLNYGDFYLDAAIRHTQLAPGDLSVSRPDGGRFTLYQEDFPLVRGWLASSTLGVARTPPGIVNSSYRIFLPTSLFGGASSVITDGRQTFMAYGGRLGRLEGSAVQTFQSTPGDVGGFGYERRSGPWAVGGQAIALEGNPQVPDHQAAALAAEYGSFGALVHHKAEVVVDSDSHFGGWFDGDITTGFMRHRFGLYDLDPGLNWGDSPLANDQRGAYWRGDYRLLRYTVSGGLEGSQTNIRDDPSRSATSSGTAYGTFSLRIDRNLTVGGGLTYELAHTRFSSSPRGSALTADAYAAWNGSLGVSRLDLSAYRATATETPNDTIDTASWSQEWPSWGPVVLTSTVNYSRENSLGARTNRSSAGLSGRGSLYNGAYWDASVVYGRVEGANGAENNVNVSASATWPFATHWLAMAQLSVTTFDVLPALPGAGEVTATQHDKRFQIGIRYEESSGVPYQALGLRGGAGGGRLSGVVFYDENGDGVRQPTERGAPNVTIYLDGRFPTTTDSQGRFSYSVVTPGSHGLRILNEALPLPWTVDEDHPLVATVPLRGEAVVDIPLTKIRP
ncbi:MAG TPA: hypothetical protein VEG27_08405 [Usitatibacter sp.]|nr:hypothetical protein [Usitatibacter sp.]